MTISAVYIDNSDDACREICIVSVSIVVLLVVLHVSGTDHNHPEYGLTRTSVTVFNVTQRECNYTNTTQ